MSTLSFLQPLWLWGLLLVPACIAWRWWWLRRGSRALPFPLADLVRRLAAMRMFS